MDKTSVVVGRSNFRNDKQLIGIAEPDRQSHLYILGQTGTGKTTLIENMVRQDISAGRGCIVFDPHGDLSLSLANYVQTVRKPAIILNLADELLEFGYNPMRRVSERLRPLLASGMLEVFKKLWAEAWGVRMEHILRNVLLTLLDQPHATLADIPRILTDKNYRSKAVTYTTNIHVKNYWSNEFNKYSKRYVNEIIAPIMNKVGGFLAHPVLARFLTESKKSLSLRRVIDEGQVLVVNLSKGKLGEDASNLIGSLLLTSVGLAAFSRADIADASQRRPSYLYVDEFHSFTTLSFVNMASELRKYGLSLVCAGQYMAQMETEIRDAIVGNFVSLICFRAGADDAIFLEKEFHPKFEKQDLMSLPNYQCYMKLMCDGQPSKPFSAKTISLS